MAAVAVVGAVTWLYLRRRQKQHQQGTLPEPSLDELKDETGVPEAPANHGHTELPTRDANATYPFNGPVEMDPQRRPVEMDNEPMYVELDAASEITTYK
jgi:hypothetical protein